MASLNPTGLDLAENDNVATAQTLLHPIDERTNDNKLLTDKSCVGYMISQSLTAPGLYLTENEAKSQDMFSSSQDKMSDNETSFTDTTRAPELTESLISYGFDVTENENMAADHNMFLPYEEGMDDGELSYTTTTCAHELTESLDSVGFDLTESGKSPLHVGDMDCSRTENLLNDSVELLEDSAQSDNKCSANEGLLSTSDLFSSKIRVMSSDLSNSDSEGQVPFPCPILPQEMNIVSPTMALSLTGENSFFDTFFPETSTQDIPAGTVQDNERIGQTPNKSALPHYAGAHSEHACESEDMNQCNGKQQLKEKRSEQFFIHQILQRIDTYQTPDASRYVQDGFLANDGMHINSSTAEGNPQLKAGHTDPETKCVTESPGTAKLSSFAFPSISSSSSSTDSIEAERDISRRPTRKSDRTKNSSLFWKQNVKGHRADTPTISFLSEDNNDNYDVVEEADLQSAHPPEQSMPSSDSKVNNGHGSLLRESSKQTFDRGSNVRDEMMKIIKEFRRLTTRDDFDIHDLEFGLRDAFNDPSSGDASNSTSFATPGSCAKTNEPSVRREFNEVNDQINETSRLDFIHGAHNSVHANQSMNGNAPVKLPETRIRVLIFDKEKECLPRSGALTHAMSTPVMSLREVSKNDEYLARQEKGNTLTGKFAKNSKRQNTLDSERGLFTATKEKSVHYNPKRVSFRTDNNSHASDQSVYTEMSQNNANVGADTSVIRRDEFNTELRFNKEHGVNRSFDMNKSERLLDKFRKAKSLPEQIDYYFPHNDDSEDMLLDFTVFDQFENNDNINFIEKQKSFDSHFDQPDSYNGSLDGTTNLAFHLESPNAKCSLNYDIDKANENEEVDSSDERKYGMKFSMSTDLETQLQDLKLVNKGILRLPTKPNSATELQDRSKDTSRSNRLRSWYSLDDSVSEASSLTNSSTRVKRLYGEHVTSFQDQPSLSEENKDIDDETELSSLDDKELSNDKEEDKLSLEFFVPGQHKYIRLHRRTFIRFVLKYSIFFLTFLFWVASVSGIGFSAWMLTGNTVVIDDVSDLFLDPYVLMGVVSGTIFLVAFLGCFGALRENICLLQLFHITLTVVLVVEVLLSSLVFLFYTMPEFRMVAKVGPEEVLKKAVKEYLDNEALRKWIDTVQKEENPYYNCSTSNPSVYRCSVPLSCCIFMPGDYINYMCGAGVVKKDESELIHIINTKGCMKSFGEWLAKNDALIGYVALGIIVPQILSVIATRFFIKNLRACKASCRQLSDPVQIVTSS